MLIAGIDEAGRGSVIGPLVIAGVLAEEAALQKFKDLGVKDSKLLTARRREVLSAEIKKVARACDVAKLWPDEIDVVVNSGRKLHKLNRLEATTMARIIENLRPDIVYVDAADVLEQRFKHHILECLPFKTKVISEHKADRNYAIVSAASIVAKVERDLEIAVLASKYGDFGSGYPHDPRTMTFLTQCIGKMTEYPDFVRKSWRPAKRVKNEKGWAQAKLI